MPTSLLSSHEIRTVGTDKSNKIFNLQTLGNGFCGENTIVLKLRTIAEQNKLNKVFRDKAAFNRFLNHCILSLPNLKKKHEPGVFFTSFVSLLEARNNELTLTEFESFLKSAHTNEQLFDLQLALAPALRSYLRELQQINEVNANGTVHLDDKELSILATALNLELHICRDEQVNPNEGEPSIFSESTVNNVADDAFKIYIVHTKPLNETAANQDDGHWSLGILAAEKESLEFWNSISISSPDNTQPQVTEQEKQKAFESVFATGERILSKVTQQIETLKNNIKTNLPKENDSVSNSALLDFLTLQFDGKPGTRTGIYCEIEVKINHAVGAIYDELDTLLLQNTQAQLEVLVQERITEAYNAAKKIYAKYLDPNHGTDTVIANLKQELETRQLSLQAALAQTTQEVHKPFGTPTPVSVGKSFQKFYSPVTPCAQKAPEEEQKQKKSFIPSATRSPSTRSFS